MNYERKFEVKTGKNFKEFYNKYRPKLVWHLMRMCKDTVQAEEIADEAFLKSLDEIDKYDAEKAQYSTWLFVIAKRLMLHRIKQNKKFESLDQVHDGATIADFLKADPYEDTVRKEDVIKKQYELIKNSIPELPVKYARVLTMREIDGMTYQDISEYLNLNLSTVKSQIRQGRILLRKRLEKDIKMLEQIY